MTTFRLPLHRTVRCPPRDQYGPIRRIVTAPVQLLARRTDGSYRDVPACRLDTGCSTTTMSATLARSLGIPFSMAEPYRLSTLTANGVINATVYHGELKVRFVADPTSTYRLFCLFSESHSPTTPLLLGLHDVLEVFRFTFDGTASPGAPTGCIHLETYP